MCDSVSQGLRCVLERISMGYSKSVVGGLLLTVLTSYNMRQVLRFQSTNSHFENKISGTKHSLHQEIGNSKADELQTLPP